MTEFIIQIGLVVPGPIRFKQTNNQIFALLHICIESISFVSHVYKTFAVKPCIKKEMHIQLMQWLSDFLKDGVNHEI